MHSEKNQKRKKDVPGPDLGSPVPADCCSSSHVVGTGSPWPLTR